MTAQYYDQPGERMDLIPTVSYGLGVPFCIIATYVVERFGLKVGLHIGGFLTGIGEHYINGSPTKPFANETIHSFWLETSHVRKAWACERERMLRCVRMKLCNSRLALSEPLAARMGELPRASYIPPMLLLLYRAANSRVILQRNSDALCLSHYFTLFLTGAWPACCLYAYMI